MEDLPDIENFDDLAPNTEAYAESLDERYEVNENINGLTASSYSDDYGGPGISSSIIRKPEDFPPDDVYIHPIDWHMRQPDYAEILAIERRKIRVREETVNALARKIEEIRKAKQISDNENGICELQLTSAGSSFKNSLRCEVMKEPPLDGTPWMGVSAAGNSSRVYIRLFSKESNPLVKSSKRKNNGNASFTSSAVLKLCEEANSLRQKKNALSLNSIEEEASVTTIGNDLWVDKYRPKNFVELLSENNLNRIALSWVKLWDECVFHHKAPALNLIRDKEKILLEVEGEVPHRPKHKILLLAGTAGVGKTTLAQTLAHHAGYDLVHVNSSDSRNVPDLERVLHSVTEMKRTVTGMQRPQILLLDEIDGAPTDSINWLCRTVTAKGKKMLRRPIIAICNNLYSPNLRELRQHSTILTIKHPQEQALVERLETIADLEAVEIDRPVIEKLIKCTEGDIRLSINTLQFLSRRKHGYIHEEDVVQACNMSCIGNASLFDQWATFLDSTRLYDSRGVLLPESNRLLIIEKVWYMANDQRERFVSGLHHNYTRHHPSLTINKIKAASDCFVFFDSINSIIQAKQNYGISRYFFHFHSMLHLLLTTHSKIQISFPMLEMNCTTKLKQNQGCIDTIRSKMTFYSGFPLVIEILPLLVFITQPTFKQTNVSLLSMIEKKVLSNISSILLHFGITFRPFSVNDQIQWLFDPLIDSLCLFPLQTNTSKTIMCNALREEIALQIAHKHAAFETSVEDQEKGKENDNGLEKETRKRRWIDLPGETTSSISKTKLPSEPNGISYIFTTCPLNSVKSKISLRHFLQ